MEKQHNNLYLGSKEAYKLILNKFTIRGLLDDIKKTRITHNDKIFIFSHCGAGNFEKIYLLVAHALSKKGYACHFLFKDRPLDEFPPRITNLSTKLGIDGTILFKKYMFNPCFPDLVVNGEQLNNTLYSKLPLVHIVDEKEHDLYFKWKIDINNCIIEARGINFYSSILNTLRRVFKGYNINFDDENVFYTYNKMIHTCDLLFHYFMIMKKYANDTNKQIRIVGWQPYYLPNSVFMFLCEELSRNRDIEFIALQIGYPKCFGYKLRESYVVSANITNSKCIHPISVTKDELQNTPITHNKEVIINSFDTKLKVDKTLSKEQEEIVAKTYFYDNIFVLFSHIFYDVINVKNLVFTDMCEWITETIDYFNKNNNLLLLLKPHPNEVNLNYPLKEPNETLRLFLENHNIKLGNNIILLHPKLFTLGKLLPYFDCGIIWSSTVGLELTYAKKPCIITGLPYYGEVLDLINPRDKTEYFNLIENKDKIEITDKQKQDVVKYMCSMKNNLIHIKQLKFDNELRINLWDKNILVDYIINGDSEVNKIIERMVDDKKA